MLTASTDIRFLKGVGEKRAELLRKRASIQSVLFCAFIRAHILIGRISHLFPNVMRAKMCV